MTNRAAPLRDSARRIASNAVARDSTALILTSGLTAVVGLVFWALAARFMSPHVLGIDTAILSLIIAAGTIAAVGTGNAFAALLPMPECDRRDRLANGLFIIATASVILGLGAGVIASRTLHLPAWWAVPGVTLGTLVMALFMAKDSAMVGLGGATRLPWQNLATSVAKLALLPILAFTAWHPAVLATVISSAVAVCIVLLVSVPRLVARADELHLGAVQASPTRRDIAVFSARDGLASTMTLGVLLSLPFLTTAVAGPVEGAVLALSLSVAQGLDLIAAGVGTALVAGLSSAGGQLWRQAAKAWAVTQAVVLLSAIGLLAASPLFVRFVGSQYENHPIVEVMGVLMLGSVVRVGFVIWASLMRAQRRTGDLLAVNAVGMAAALPAIFFGAREWGAVGSALGLLMGSLILGVIGLSALARGLRRNW